MKQRGDEADGEGDVRAKRTVSGGRGGEEERARVGERGQGCSEARGCTDAYQGWRIVGGGVGGERVGVG